MNPNATRRALPFALIAAFILVAFAAIPCLGQCSSLYTYANVNAPGTYVTGFTDLANMGGVALVGGKGNPIVGIGTDSGNYPGFRPAPYTCPQYYWLKKLTATDIVIAGATAQNPKWDACPAYWTDRMTAVIWELVGEGTSGHSARFVAATTRFDSRTSRFNFSLGMQPANQKALMEVPAPVVLATLDTPEGLAVSLVIPSPNTGAGLAFADNAAFSGQHFLLGETRPAVVTGWDLYVKASPEEPTSGQATGWQALGTVALDLAPGATSTHFNVVLPTDGVTPFYFALAPRFLAGFRPHLGSQGTPRYFVGRHSAAAVPGGAFAQVGTDALIALTSADLADGTWGGESEMPAFVPRDLVLSSVPEEAPWFLDDLGARPHARDGVWTARWSSTDETEVFYYEVVLSRPDGEILAISDWVLAAGEPSAYDTEVSAPGSERGPVVVTVLVTKTDGTTTRSPGVHLRAPLHFPQGASAR